MTEDLEEFSPQRLFCYNITTKSEGKHITLPWPVSLNESAKMISKKGIKNGGVSKDPEKKLLRQVISVIGKGSGAYLFGAPPTDSERNPVLFEADSAQGTCDLSAIVQALAFARYQDAVEDAAVLLCGATAKLAGRSLNKCNAGLHFIIRKQSKNSKKAKTAGASAVGSLTDKESYDPILSQNNPRASQIFKRSEAGTRRSWTHL
jgi:hypothetical protein